ncbi:MAG: C4-type zinc ribbon domain-containing protein [Phycisphaeraceae bacterium]|nr:C4-type zinc ribbon domain-containing protein [Phycisphaeraceae bacterium]
MTLHDALHALFVLDQQVRGLQSRLDSAAHHVRSQEIKIKQLNDQLNELKDQLKQTRASEANLESEAVGIEERINKLREQMNNAQTNKEYSAFLVEVNTLKVDKAKKEEEALELMSEIEALEAKVQEAENRLNEQKKIKSVADQELANRTSEVGQQLEELKRKRESAASEVPDKPLALFNKMADDTEGEAMAPVVREDPRRLEFTCGGCYMSIPAETINRLFSQEDVVQCTSCRRILFLEKELRQSMGSK